MSLKNILILCEISKKDMDSLNCIIDHIKYADEIDYKTLENHFNGYIFHNEILATMTGERAN